MLKNCSYKDIKATGWYQYLEDFWARHYDNPTSLTENCKRKYHVGKATIMVHKDKVQQRGIFSVRLVFTKHK